MTPAELAIARAYRDAVSAYRATADALLANRTKRDAVDAYFDARRTLASVEASIDLDLRPDATAPDPVEAEHGIDPSTRPAFRMPHPSAMKVAAVFPDPQSVDFGVHITSDTITIDRKHALALIGGALTLANDLVKRQHPRNAARYRDAALALTEALALPPLADDPTEES